MKTPSRIAIIHTWPDIKNAEFEVVERIKLACVNCGIDIDVINSQGIVIESNILDLVSRKVSNETHLFAISLHFQSPKVFDLYTYIALWNPVDYYHVFGFSAVTEKTCSHDDVLSCESSPADALALLNFQRLGKRYLEPIKLFHNCPKPYLGPNITSTATLFYVGINWERLSGRKGRFHDLLLDLDENNMVDIYGPELFLNQRPWEGFKNYKGEIPFDGKSVVNSINAAGICLALSSKQHQDSGILSNRLFEGMAGGAVVITNKHPLVNKYFQDCVYILDDENLTEGEIAIEVKNIIHEIRSDVRSATSRVLRSQEILSSLFSLEGSLEKLVSMHHERAKYARPYIYQQNIIDILLICDYRGVDPKDVGKHLRTIFSQDGVRGDLVVLISHDVAQDPEGMNLITKLGFKADAAFKLKLVTASFSEALEASRGRLFSLVRSDEEFQRHHFASLAFALLKDESALAACSGALMRSFDQDGLISDSFVSNAFELGEEISDLAADYGFGRLLFRSEVLDLLPASLFPLLAGHEVNLIAAFARSSASLAETGLPSYIWLRYLYPRVASERRPLRYDRELVRNLLPVPHPANQQSPSRDRAPVHSVPFEVRLDHIYRATPGAEGAKILGEGFGPFGHFGTAIRGVSGNILFQTPVGSADLCIILRVSVQEEETFAKGAKIPGRCYDVYLGDEILGQFNFEAREQLLSIYLPRNREVLGRIYSIWINISGYHFNNGDEFPAAKAVPTSFVVLSFKVIEATARGGARLHEVGSNSLVDDKVDSAWYLEKYRDVKDAESDPIYHFENYGRAEGRFPNFAAEKAAYWEF